MPETKTSSTVLDVLKVFWKSMATHKVMFVFIVLAYASTSVFQIITPLYYKRFFDVLTAEGLDKSVVAPQLTQIIFIILGINILMWLAFRSGTFVMNTFESRVIANLKQQAFDYLVDHSYNFFSTNFAGSLTQRINRLGASFERLFDSLIFSVIPLAVSILGVGIVVWSIKPLITLIIFVWVAVFMSFNYFFAKFKLKYDLQVADTDSKATALLSDAITNHSAIQLFSSSTQEVHAYKKVTDAFAKICRFTWNLTGVVDAVQASLIFIVEFLLFYFAIKYWQMGIISIGTFVLIQVYFINLGSRLWEFSRIIRNIYQGFASAKEMVDTMLLPHEVRDTHTAKNLSVTKGQVNFEKVSFAFNSTKNVLSHLSVSIPPGQKIALIGPSGAGKSTFVKLLLRLYDVESGAITIDGINIKDVTQNSLREHIGMVPQDPMLFHRTLKENIMYGSINARDEDIYRAARLAHCDEFIQNLPLKYDTHVGERGIKLSGGERQRIAIARAILKNPPILILDEATSSLDSESEALIQDALDTLMKDKTTIVIAHRLSTIRKMDRIVVMDDGKIVEDGTHQELIKKPEGIYNKLWKLQAGGFIN